MNTILIMVHSKTGYPSRGPTINDAIPDVYKPTAKETALCARIGDIQVWSPTFADDMMIVALSKRALQTLVQKADDFSTK